MTVTSLLKEALWRVPHESWTRVEQMLMREGIPISIDNGGVGRGDSNGVIIAKNPYYILAPSAAADEHSRVLKQDDTFGVFNRYGDIEPIGLGEEGLYHEGTRFLSCLRLRLFEARPLMLSSTVRADNAILTVDLTNPDINPREGPTIPRGMLHICRAKFLWHGSYYERLTIRNYDVRPLRAAFSLHCEADFADIFEVRGTKRKKRGDMLPATMQDGALVLCYRGLDGEVRRARILCSPEPREIKGNVIHFDVSLESQQETFLELTVACEGPQPQPRPLILPHAVALREAGAAAQRARSRWCTIETTSERLNHWLHRSQADLDMMCSETSEGAYPYAGVPWFSTAFGRDGILTALQCLWVNPALARGVLAYLAATQATAVIPEQDAEPGKILHETRRGEMAALGEIPFGRYYGSIDATPLFVILAGSYYERTNDRDFIKRIWPNVERALHWIETYGDLDGDGFVEYARHSSQGLVQQGWKDSHDSVFHADGSPAEAPIALCEVQAYVYAAWRAAAALAMVLGDSRRADDLENRAHRLGERFEQAFWCDDLSTYALALDARKRPCRVRTSNAGQCLFAGIAAAERARRLAATLFSSESFSGWGVRTVAAGEARYNPMAYHNGSIWPHDNALIAFGLSRYRLKEGALRILGALFEASQFFDVNRVPELFCGFERRPDEGPTLYPVACSPQAWAAGSVYLLLQACLGLHIDAPARRLSFTYPRLPDFVKEVWLRNLKIVDATLSVRLVRHAEGVSLEVQERKGQVEVITIK